MTRGKVGRVAMLAAALALTGGLVAFAADDDKPAQRADCTEVAYDSVGCTFTHAGGGSAAPGGGGAQAGSEAASQAAPKAVPASDPTLVWNWELRRDPAGNTCWVASSRRVDDPAERARQQRAADDAYLAQARGQVYERCPEPAAAATTSAPPSATPGYLRTADVEQRLGAPAPRIQPGRAITGKTAFLELGGAGARRLTFADPLGGPGATVDARPTYRVDWGDGTSTETTSAGGPWPHGDVTHVYQRVGRYDVVVTARWTAHWTGANGEGGELTGLQTEGRLPRFPVTEVQAVRER